jgi:hypothetical protein
MNKIIFIIVVIFNSFAFSQNFGNWIELDSMNIARGGHALVELPNGDVLVSGSGVDSIQSSSEIYEFSTGKWRYTSHMNIPRTRHQMLLLSTNKILTIGGLFERSCEIFDPQTETWTMTDSIPTFRYNGQTVTELSDGRVMVTGGYYVDTTSWNFVILDKVDIYDPVSKTWIEATPMKLGRWLHTATLLNDGRVLVAGGNTENFQTNECEIYEPSDNSWIVAPPMLESRYEHATILLNNGDVFVNGGGPAAGYSCELYNVTENQWFSVDDMLAYRTGHKIYCLSEMDKLLILGGDAQPETSEDTWEIYDPISLTPVYKESFPTNIFLKDNNLQMSNENIFVAGGEEYEIPEGGLPYTWPSKRSWTFAVVTNINENHDIKIKGFKLEQNYPNPFNPSTTIIYDLPNASKVELKVYDLLGNELTTLVNEEKLAGIYEITFNGSGLASGTYFYQIKAGDFIQTKKLMLLK